MAKKKEQNNGASGSYTDIIKRFNEIVSAYSYIPKDGFYSAFERAGYMFENQAQLQNQRIKAISTLPADYTKDEIGDMLRAPYGSEIPLRATSETLKWTAYPYFKIIKTYADIPTYHYYAKPLFMEEGDSKSKEFLREATLLEKLNRALSLKKNAHKIVGDAVTLGKVFYTLRVDVDKSHNKVNYAFMQQLPQDWCYIIGYNNVSGYTVSFDMMYFLQPGTDYRQFGDLFEPYVRDFNKMFEPPKSDKKLVYAQYASVDCKGKTKLNFYPGNLEPISAGNPKVFQQNGRWMYYVSLPIEKVWTFEIDDTSPAVISPLSGLMLTYAQQSDYEAAQLSLLLNPLIKIFTGEIPYREAGATTEDAYKLSLGGRQLFETLFTNLMIANNTGGAAFFSAPVENIKSHDYTASANANEISETFNRYGNEKAGLSGILPATDDVKASQVDASQKIESRFATAVIYPQFERMMNAVYQELNLKYEWEFKMFGTIFTDDKIRENAMKSISNGDISAHFVLAALDDESWIDKLSMMRVIKQSGMLDLLIPPVTSYTMKQETSNLPPQNKTEGMTDSLEKAIDAGVTGIEREKQPTV